MSFDFLGELNWLAVIVGAVIYFVLAINGTYHALGILIAAIIVAVWR